MKRALSKEEFAAKLRLEMEELGKNTPAPDERKEASVMAFRSFTHIFSLAVYGAAYNDPDGYSQYHPPQLAHQVLGQEARTALQSSRFITPDHPEWDRVMRFPTDADIKAENEADKARAGVKTLKALYNGAGNVSLEMHDGEITITPWRYRGRAAWEGFQGQEKSQISETATDAELGAAIAAGLEISRKA